MTDTERNRIEAICKVARVKNIEDLSDGFHTFRQLYFQRMMLFATIVKQNKDRAWKSLKHEEGELCFGGGWFIVGIDTPEGSYTYHYEDKYFDLFDCEILDYGKHWDGHTEKDVTRLLSLPSAEPKTPSNGSITCVKSEKMHDRTMGDLISRQDVLHELEGCDYELKDWQRWKLKTMVRDIPSAEKTQLSGEDATSVCKCPCEYREPCDYCHYDAYRGHGCPSEEGLKDE